MWKPKSLDEAQLPALILTWLCGNSIIQYPLNHLRIRLTIIYFIFWNSIYAVCLFNTVLYIINAAWIGYEETFYLTLICVNIFLMYFNIGIGWIHRNKVVKISKNSTILEGMIKDLGRPITCIQDAYKHTLRVILYWGILAIGLNISSVLWKSMQIPLLSNICIIFTLQHPVHVNSTIDLNFGLSIRSMGLRLKYINKVLLDSNNSIDNDWIINSHSHSVPVTSRSTYKPKKINFSGYDNHVIPVQCTSKILQLVKYIHLEINILCNKTMAMYGFQLSVTMGITFLVTTFLGYMLYLNIWNQAITHYEKIIRSIVLLCWIIVYVLKFTVNNYVCAEAIAEYKRTGEIIHQIDIQTQNLELRNEIQQFSIQIMQNPLVFSPCGMIQLGYPLFKEFIGSVTTYLIILIQMSDVSPIKKIK